MHSLPWQVKRLVVQSVQIVSGTPNFVIIVIRQYLWVTSHIVHLNHQTYLTVLATADITVYIQCTKKVSQSYCYITNYVHLINFYLFLKQDEHGKIINMIIAFTFSSLHIIFFCVLVMLEAACF